MHRQVKISDKNVLYDTIFNLKETVRRRLKRDKVINYMQL